MPSVNRRKVRWPESGFTSLDGESPSSVLTVVHLWRTETELHRPILPRDPPDGTDLATCGFASTGHGPSDRRAMSRSRSRPILAFHAAPQPHRIATRVSPPRCGQTLPAPGLAPTGCRRGAISAGLSPGCLVASTRCITCDRCFGNRILQVEVCPWRWVNGTAVN